MKKILVVDDEENIRSLYGMLFEEKGYEVMTASDGRSALRIFELWDPDLVILDIMMPGLDGLTVLSTMRRRKDVPIIIYTAYKTFKGDPSTWGSEDVIIKSSDPTELLNKIDEILSRA
jgi:DNA-binding response OmpR family regulator